MSTRNLSALALLLMLATLPAGATTYRWVDEQGKVHYGDVMPNQPSGMGHKELDKQGRVRKEAPRTRLTPQERERQVEALARQQEASQQQELRRRHDQALLTTYVNEEEIDLVRDRALELEALNLRGLKTRLNAAAEKLTYANEQIAHYEKDGQQAPRLFPQMRDEAHTELALVSELIRQREKTLDDTRARFEADKVRFRELKAASPR